MYSLPRQSSSSALQDREDGLGSPSSAGYSTGELHLRVRDTCSTGDRQVVFMWGSHRLEMKLLSAHTDTSGSWSLTQRQMFEKTTPTSLTWTTRCTFLWRVYFMKCLKERACLSCTICVNSDGFPRRCMFFLLCFLCRTGRCIVSTPATMATSAASSTTCVTQTSSQYVCSCCTRTWDSPVSPSSAPETSSADKSWGEWDV